MEKIREVAADTTRRQKDLDTKRREKVCATLFFSTVLLLIVLNEAMNGTR